LFCGGTSYGRNGLTPSLFDDVWSTKVNYVPFRWHDDHE